MAISLTDMLKFLVTQFQGDLSVFKIPIKEIDALSRLSSNNNYDYLIKASNHDSLLHVLRLMKDKRVSLVPIEESIGKHEATVGLCFLNDLHYLLKLPDFWKFLQEPVMNFLKELNGFEDDEATDQEEMIFSGK